MADDRKSIIKKGLIAFLLLGIGFYYSNTTKNGKKMLKALEKAARKPKLDINYNVKNISKPIFKSKPTKRPTNKNYDSSSDPFKIKNYDFINEGYMNDRIKILKQKCKEYVKETGITPTTSRDTMTVLKNYIGKYNLRAIRYDPRYSSFYCLQHKAGSTHFNIALSQIKNSVNPDIEHGISKYAIPHAPSWLEAALNGERLKFAKDHEYVEKWTVDQLSRDFKPLQHSVLLIRHPLSRLHSSWGHRFKLPKTWKPGTPLPRQHLIDRMRTELTKPGDPEIPKNYSVTLVSFLRLVLALNGGGDVHWETVVRTCRPCDYDGYNVVIHTNTAKEDCTKFAKFLGKSDVVEMKERYSQNLSVNTTTFDADAYVRGQQRYFRENVPRQVTKDIYDGPYHWDFELFGFTYDDYLADF